MRLFFDRRLGYFVTAPGQDTALTSLQAKAGDTAEVQVVFGRSSDPTGASSIVDAPTWTPENLPGGTVITIAVKEDGNFGDSVLLAGTSTFSLNSGTNTYTFSLPLNTEAINDALFRLDDDDENDLETLASKFELTFQEGGSGGWQSSILPVSFTLYNDLIGGSEGTPVNADDPDEYLLKASGYEWLPTVTSKTGGTSADLDAIPTVDRPTGGVVAFKDTDSALNKVRLYRLESGTNAEDSPDYIRPDDFNESTNAKVWVFLPQVSEATGIADVVDDTTPQLGGPLDANGNQIKESKGADVASATSLAIGNDGNYFVVTGTTTIATIATKGIGTEITLQFSGALILTHSADLVLPTAANITTAAGDVAKFREHASGEWRCVSYLRANGQALSGAGGGGISNIVDDTTPQLGGPLDANGNQIRESKGADVASASNLAIGNDGNFFVVTGTTTIATIASKGIGTEVTLQFSGALILTHSADLILPTAANITTAAGDIAKFREHASGDWRCVSYLRANGQALAGVGGAISNLVEDLTPQLGGDLDANNRFINFDSFTGIGDQDGNEQLLFESTAFAVNYATLKNSATGSGPTISAKGSDTNIDLNIVAKGTGVIKAQSVIRVDGKMVKLAKGANVASANNLNLGEDGNQFDVTGTTAITSIASKGIGTQVKLRFNGALTLTHNATDLVLPGAANIITAAGDEAEFIEYASGDWRCTNYQRASGLSLVSTGIPSGSVQVTAANRDLINSTDNGKYILVGNLADTVTIDRQSTGGWTNGAHFWVANRRTSGNVTVAPDGGVSIVVAGTSSGSVVIGHTDRPVHFWRESENNWVVIS